MGRDMSRRKPTENEHIYLINQVDALCPLCRKTLMYDKKNTKRKGYEIAHIYPSSPTAAEKELLKDEKLLNPDVEHRDNLIPLCNGCHTKFDNPRTVEEYRKLFAIKAALIEIEKQRDVWSELEIHEDIVKIFEQLAAAPTPQSVPLSYDPKVIDNKLDKTIQHPTYVMIKAYVSEYYGFIQDQLKSLDVDNSGVSVIIMTEVKLFYLNMKKNTSNQQEIFESLVDWFQYKTTARVKNSTEIVAAYFIQNCEVFE